VKRRELTHELLLTSPEFFGLTTATPVARAACRILDGLPLGELVECDDVRIALGGDDALRALARGGTAPAEFRLFAPLRTGKSLLSAVSAIKFSQSVDDSPLRHGEVIRIGVQSLDVDKGNAIRQHLDGVFATSKALRPLLLEEPTSDGYMLRHPSGRPVEVKVLAGARAGGQWTSRWIGAAIFDELPRMLGSADGLTVNFDDAHDTVENRILRGGCIVGIGSLWAPWGPALRDVTEHLGKPTRHMVVMKTTGPAMNPSWFTPERCAEILARNPRTHRVDVLGEFAQGVSDAIDADAARACLRHLDEGAVAVGPVVMGCDWSDGRANATAWLCAQWIQYPERWEDAGEWKVTETGLEYFEPLRHPNGTHVTRKVPASRRKLHVFAIGFEANWAARGLTSDDIFDTRIASVARTEGAHTIFADEYNRMTLQSAAQKRGLRWVAQHWDATTKQDALAVLRGWVSDGDLIIEPGPGGERLVEELLRLKEIIRPSGAVSIGARQGNDDVACALLNLAMAQATGLELPGSPAGSANTMTVQPGSAVSGLL
jgi:hypothetical protein